MRRERGREESRSFKELRFQSFQEKERRAAQTEVLSRTPYPVTPSLLLRIREVQTHTYTLRERGRVGEKGNFSHRMDNWMMAEKKSNSLSHPTQDNLRSKNGY